MASLMETLGVLSQAGGGFAQGVDRRQREKVAKEERERVLKLQEDRLAREEARDLINAAHQRKKMELANLSEERRRSEFDITMAVRKADAAEERRLRKEREDLDREFNLTKISADALLDIARMQLQGGVAIIRNLPNVLAYRASGLSDPLLDAYLGAATGDVLDFGNADTIKQVKARLKIKEPSVTAEDGRVLDATMRTAGVTPESQVQGPLSLPFAGVPSESTDALSTNQTPPTGPFPLPGAGLVQGAARGLFGIRGPEQENFFRRQAVGAPPLTPGLQPNSAFQLFPVVPTP